MKTCLSLIQLDMNDCLQKKLRSARLKGRWPWTLLSRRKFKASWFRFLSHYKERSKEDKNLKINDLEEILLIWVSSNMSGLLSVKWIVTRSRGDSCNLVISGSKWKIIAPLESYEMACLWAAKVFRLSFIIFTAVIRYVLTSVICM